MSGDVDPKVRVLRGEAREKLVLGVDTAKVVYDLSRDAHLAGLSDKQLRGILADLRNEGRLPNQPVECTHANTRPDPDSDELLCDDCGQRIFTP